MSMRATVRTGWQRSIKCLISWIISHKYVTNYRALLQKVTYKDKASYESSPRCNEHSRGSYVINWSLTTQERKEDKIRQGGTGGWIEAMGWLRFVGSMKL